MAARYLWDLNLLADAELAWHAAGKAGPYAPSKKQQANARAYSTRLRQAIQRSLPGDDHAFLEPYGPVVKESGAGRIGMAFAQTDLAASRLEAAGASVFPGCTRGNGALMAANTRSLLTQVLAARGADLPGAMFSADSKELESALTMADGPAQGWLAKRAHGFASRNRRRFRGEMDDAGRTWLAAGCQEGGVRIEPLLRVRVDLAIHGWLRPDGSSVWGGWAMQAFVAVEDEPPMWPQVGANSLMPDNLAPAAVQLCEDLTTAWHHLGYSGPVGIDAILYQGPQGELCGHLASDANARFTMGWFQGMHSTLTNGGLVWG